jgi:D-alanyl-D-alanine carboxypeptidase/D-alanyl-D-alanine-endopeptidase (penicillin-binding protein 4)
MPRARWWVIGALSVLTVSVVLLDATGVIFDDAEPASPPPVSLPTPMPEESAVTAPIEPTQGAAEPAVLRRVDRLLHDSALGPSVHAVVAPLASPNEPWSTVDPNAAATPASTLKLWTAAATLDALEPDVRLSTSVVWDESSHTLVIVGGGDATLLSGTAGGEGAASLTSLAHRTTHALDTDDLSAGDERVTLDYDTSLFTGPDASPGWEPTYVTSGVIAPVTALMVDQGMVDPPSLARYPDPAAAAADEFADLLRDQGVTVRDHHDSVTAARDYPSAEEIASVSSAPIGEMVEQMLRNSDNQIAEALGRLAAGEAGLPRSFAGAAKAVVAAADARGVDTTRARVVDASGLSRHDRFSATGLAAALHFAAEEPALSPILSGLAVAGFNGTLADRFQSGISADGAGVVRAKTGTLTGISAEAGVTTTCDGVLVSFAFVADRVADTEAARAVLDEAAATLATCPKRQ